MVLVLTCGMLNDLRLASLFKNCVICYTVMKLDCLLYLPISFQKFFRKRPVRELLPAQPIEEVSIDPWWIAHIGYITEDDVKVGVNVGVCVRVCMCACMCVLCVKVCICWYMNACQTYTNIHLSLCAHLWHFASIVHSMLIVSWVCGYISLCSAVHWNRESHNRLYHWHWTSTSWRTWQDSSAW